MSGYGLVVKKEKLYVFILYAVFLPLLYFFIDFDSARNLDYIHYQNNYNNLYGQFEVGYTFFERLAQKVGLNFDEFWHFLIFFELILISILYTNPYVFILALPNLIFLSQGLFGTQIRFGIAVLLCMVIYKFLFNSKKFYFFIAGTALFHNGSLVFLFISFYLKRMFSVERGLLFKRNLNALLFYIIILILLSFFVRYIFLLLGYDYYAAENSKHMVVRSLSSIIYSFVLLIFIGFLLIYKRRVIDFSSMVYLGGGMLILSLIFYDFSIISGRYNLAFFLVEPFVLYSFYKSYGKDNLSGFLLFSVLLIVTYSKLLVLDLML